MRCLGDRAVFSSSRLVLVDQEIRSREIQRTYTGKAKGQVSRRAQEGSRRRCCCDATTFPVLSAPINCHRLLGLSTKYKVWYSAMNPPLVPILSHTNPAHVLQFYSFKIHFNNILASRNITSFLSWGAPQQMLRTHRSLEAYFAALLRRRYDFFAFSCNGAPMEWNWMGKTETLGGGGGTCPSVTLSITNATRTDPGSNPGLRCDRSASNRPNNVTARIRP
jgi:hypothetical protein